MMDVTPKALFLSKMFSSAFTLVLAGYIHAQCPELRTIFTTLGGSPNLINATSALSCCSNSTAGYLSGIDCTLGKITAVSWRNMGLSGNASLVFSNQTVISLQTLDLSQNSITAIPEPATLPSIVSLNLSSLALVDKSLSNTWPSHSGIVSLDLSNNGISSCLGNIELPWYINQMSSLKYLYLANNSFTGTLPYTSCSTVLVTLDLSYNKLTSLSSLYCGYSSFRNLNVSNNLITSFSGATFSSTLLYADVSANKLTSSPTSVYKNSLTFLNISNNQIVADVSSIAYMSSLVTLDASFNNLTSNSFDPPTFPSNLNRLDLRRNKLTWSITRYFYWYFPYSLKTLRLDDNMITGSSKTMVSQLQGEYTSSISVTTLTYNGTQMIDLNECEIAASVYTALNGAPANRPSTTSNTACCTAAMTSLLGIYCEVKSSWTNPVQYYPHIQSINWGGLNMNGNLTVALAPFKNLIFLNSFDVGGNFLTGSLPAIIGRLAENINTVVRLVNLTLSANQFTGSLPSFTSLPALRLIDVSTNQITGSLSGFTAINENPLTIVPPSSVSINLANNQLSGSYPGIDYFFRKKFLRSQSFKTFNIDGNNFISQFDCQIAAAAWTALSGNVSLTPLTNTCNACCDGTKIVCDGDTITEINWQNQQLFGNAQFLFQNLYYLRTISLTQNRLTGPLPEFSSTYLVNLHLTSNGFDGSIPASWSNLSKLRSLRIGSNYISGSFPSSLFGIETLNYLDVSSNSFSGPLPSNPTPNKILPIYALDFGRNQFTGGIPETWSNLTYCQSINLGNNQLSGNWTEQILRLPTTATLQSLHINKNSFTGSWFNFNSYFTGLSTLDISDNLITGVVPATATVKTSMNLYIGGNTLTGALPSSFMNCDSLNASFNSFVGSVPFAKGAPIRYFFVANNNLSAEIPDSLFTSSLYGVDLSYNQISGSIPNTIVSATSLWYFNVSHNSITGSLPFWNVSTLMGGTTSYGLSSLETFDASYNSITGVLSPSIASLTRLNALILRNNTLTGTIPDILGSMSQLYYLDLSNNYFVGAIPTAFVSLVRLQYLDLSYNVLSGQVPAGLSDLNSTLTTCSFGNNNCLCDSIQSTSWTSSCSTSNTFSACSSSCTLKSNRGAVPGAPSNFSNSQKSIGSPQTLSVLVTLLSVALLM